MYSLYTDLFLYNSFNNSYPGLLSSEIGTDFSVIGSTPSATSGLLFSNSIRLPASSRVRASNILISPNFTVNFWLRFPSISSSNIGIATIYHSTSSVRNVQMYINPSTGALRLYHNASMDYTFFPTVNIWYMVTLYKNNTRAYLYINGNLIGSRSSTSNTQAYAHLEFHSYNGSNVSETIDISQVSVYNRNLTSEEKLYLYNNGDSIDPFSIEPLSKPNSLFFGV